jgi:hypothetical protein
MQLQPKIVISKRRMMQIQPKMMPIQPEAVQLGPKEMQQELNIMWLQLQNAMTAGKYSTTDTNQWNATNAAGSSAERTRGIRNLLVQE